MSSTAALRVSQPIEIRSTGPTVPEAKITRLNEKIATLRDEIQRLNALNARE